MEEEVEEPFTDDRGDNEDDDCVWLLVMLLALLL
jgi:hypothetical protein